MTSAPQPGKPRAAVANWLVCIVLVATLLRVGTAIGLVERNRRAGVVHEFPDSELYWKLALSMADGQPYDDGKRRVLRTPGYPAFLAASITLFGKSTSAARVLQAAVGSASCVLLFFIVRRLLGTRTGLMAAFLAAIHPYAILLSAVLLSESVFTFVLLLQLLCLVQLFSGVERDESMGGTVMWCTLMGFTAAAATLVRPSWFLAIPLIASMAVWVSTQAMRRKREALARVPLPAGDRNLQMKNGEPTGHKGKGGARLAVCAAPLVVLLAFVLGMTPWWIRNWRVTGHFVPTTLWVGASLYDGLNDRATGASQMEFMDRPDQWALDTNLPSMNEWEQDRYLRDEAWRFARSHPRRVVELAAVKFYRFWNPLPNAAEWSGTLVRLASLATCGPILVLAMLGAWRLRKRWNIITILAGPVLYFSLIHLVFVSSIRYREAATLPLLGLVAAALVRPQERDRVVVR